MAPEPKEDRKVANSTYQEPRMAAAPRMIWGADAIGRSIGRSENYVRKTLVKLDGSPVGKIGGRYFVVEDKLMAFMDRLVQTKPV